MMNLKKTALLLAVTWSALLVAGCDVESDVEKARKGFVGRFDVVKELYLLDGKHGKYPNTGEIWRDRETGKCYLYMFGGSGNGGPALTPFECN